mgnify:CR=1 FL=1
MPLCGSNLRKRCSCRRFGTRRLGVDLAQDVHHFDGALRALGSLVARFRASTLNRLLDGVGGEDAEEHGNLALEGDRGDALGDLRADVVIVAGGTADHRAEGDDAVKLAALRYLLAYDGKLESPGDTDDHGVIGIHAVAGEIVHGSGNQTVDDEIVKTGGDDGDAAEKIVIQVGYGNNPGEPTDLAMQKWQELLAERSNGTMELELFPSSQLGSQADLTDQIVMGERLFPSATHRSWLNTVPPKLPSHPARTSIIPGMSAGS